MDEDLMADLMSQTPNSNMSHVDASSSFLIPESLKKLFQKSLKKKGKLMRKELELVKARSQSLWSGFSKPPTVSLPFSKHSNPESLLSAACLQILLL